MMDLRPEDQVGYNTVPERPAPVAPKLRVNSPAASEYARVASTAINAGPETLAYFKVKYEETGKIDEYERLKALSANVRDAEQAELVGGAIRRSMAENGISPVMAIKNDPNVKASIEDAKMLRDNPIAYDAVRQVQAVDLPPDADAYDVEDHENKKSMPLTIKSVRESLAGGKKMWEIVHAAHGDQLGAHHPVRDFFVGMFSTAITPWQSRALAKAMDVELSTIETFAPGAVDNAIREAIVKSTPENRDVLFGILHKTIAESPAFWTDYGVFNQYENIFSQQLVEGTGTSGATGGLMDTAAPLLDATGVYGVGRLGLKLTGRALAVAAAPAIKMMLEGSKEVGGDAIVVALRGTEEVAQGKFGVSKPELAHLGMPKFAQHVDSVIDDTPDLAEKIRILELRDTVASANTTVESELFSVPEKVSMVKSTAKALESIKHGTVQVGKTEIAPYTDGTGFRMTFTIGKDGSKGYGSLGEALMSGNDALASGAGRSATIWVSDDAVLSPLMTLKEASELSASELTKRGNYFVRITDDKAFTGLDHLLSKDGVAMDIAHGWLGRARNWVGNPAAWMDSKVYRNFNRRFSVENHIVSRLDAIVTPFTKLKRVEKLRINDALEWSADFGTKNKRTPTMREVNEQFGGTLTEAEKKGLYSARAYFDVLHMLENKKLYDHLFKDGSKTIRTLTGKASWHGKPLAEGAELDDVTRVFNPATGAIEGVSPSALKALYASGGRIIKTKLAPAVDGTEEIVHHVVFDPQYRHLIEFGDLSRVPLKYIHGYFPRMYEDSYVIERTIKGAKVDGKVKDYTAAIHTASSRKEAEAAVRALNAKSKNKAHVYSIKADSRLKNLDDTAASQELMQMEGRLFWDDRKTHLTHVSGAKADVIAPVNTIARSARIIARQLASEDYNVYVRGLWDQQYKDFLEKYGVKIGDGVDDVGTAIAELQKVINIPGSGKAAKDALESFRYMQYMRGVGDSTSHIMRSKMMAAGEFLYNSGLLGAAAGKSAAQNFWKFDPLQLMRESAFFVFITANPMAQMTMNMLQHSFIMAIDPLYFGRHQLDTGLLMSGVKALNIMQSTGETAAGRVLAANAKLMRLSVEDYTTLIKKYAQSGLPNNVNIRASMGDLPLEAAQVPMSSGAAVASKTWGAVSARPLRRKMEQWGFDSGERINQSASYLMALRQVMKANKVKKIGDLTEAHWEEVAKKGIDYSSAMIRPNSSRYQRGLLAPAFQFLSFVHKATLTMIGQNRAFTKAETTKIILGQLLLFGGNAYGIKSYLEKKLPEIGVTNPTAVDIISGGMLDYLLDTSVNAITGDNKANSDFGGYLAPLSLIGRTAENLVDMVFENGPVESFFGVSGYGMSKIYEAGKMTSDLVNAPDSMSWNETKWLNVLDAISSGMLAGYSNFAQARVAHRLGFWQAANGEMSSVAARTSEVILKGMLNIQPEEVANRYMLMKDMNSMHGDGSKADLGAMKTDAKEYYERVRRMVVRYGDGTLSKDAFEAYREAETSLILGTMDEVERAQFWKEFNSLRENERGQQSSLSQAIVDAVRAGGHPKEWMITAIQNSSMEDQEKADTIEFLEAEFASAEAAMPAMMNNLSQEYIPLIPSQD